MKRKIKVIAVLMMLLLVSNSVLASAQSIKGQDSATIDAEDILVKYQEQVAELNATGKVAQKRALQAQTVKQLHDAGYQAYGVNADTYQEVETQLNTDFGAMGLDPNCSYIVMLEEVTPSESVASVGGRSSSYTFTYTWNGVQYSMRRLSVTAADDSRYFKTSTYNLLSNPTRDSIIACFNTAVSVAIGIYSTAFGTVATICGFAASELFDNPSSVTLNLNAATTWTRTYIQVYGNGTWNSGYSVEEVRAASYISGYYYRADVNSQQQILTNESSSYKVSPNHYNDGYANQKAVENYTYNIMEYDTVGDTQYYYGGSVVVTHVEDF